MEEPNYCSDQWLKPLSKEHAKSQQTLPCLQRFGDPLDWLPFFTELNCRFQGNISAQPAIDPRKLTPAFAPLNAFLSADTNQALILLGDSGFGKSTLLTLLYLFQQFDHWPEGVDCELRKVTCNTPKQISELKNQKQTILLLDGLNEVNIEAGNLTAFLQELLAAAKGFKRVILSSNNRFFGKFVTSIDNGSKGISIGEHPCSLMILYGFDNVSADLYLENKYSKQWYQKLNKNVSKERALEIASRLRNLKFRPLLLSHIEDLAENTEPTIAEYTIYEAIVLQWLIRESATPQSRSCGATIEPIYELLKFMARSLETSKSRSIATKTLNSWAAKDPNRIPIQELALSTPSIILKIYAADNETVSYAFSHNSVQEFVVAQEILDSSGEKEIKVPENISERTLDFIVKGRQKNDEHRDKTLVMPHMKPSNTLFKKPNFSGSPTKPNKSPPAKREAPETLTANQPYELNLGNETTLELIWVNPGFFHIGEEPSTTQIVFKNGFWMSKFPITQKQYTAMLGANPSSHREAGENAPVEEVSWHEAQSYCARLTKHLAKQESADYHFRLPKELEWEYACRAGSKTTFSFGGDESQLQHFGWSARNSAGTPHPVGQKHPNAWGFHDMHGNVWEWCDDWSSDFLKATISDLKGPTERTDRVIRGGSWSNGPSSCRSSIRNWYQPNTRYDNLGFRVVIVPKPTRKIET